MSSNDRQARGRCAVALVAAALVFALTDSGGASDIDGNGLDELGAFAIETQGQARGPWLQLYSGTGQTISSFFLGPGVHDVQIQKIDYDGDGLDEVVTVAIAPSGQRLLEVRNAGGTLLASVVAAEPGAQRLALFEIDIDGLPPAEIGLAYTRGGPGISDPFVPLAAGLVQVWRHAPGTPGGLTKISHLEVIPAGFADHTWMVADVGGDGRQELVAGYSEPPSLLAGDPASHGAVARVVRPLIGLPATEIVVADAAFDSVQWVVGDFVEANPGQELMAGLRRRSDGVGVLRVLDLSGQLANPRLVELDATPLGATELSWRAIRRDQPSPQPGQPPAPESHRALVGFRQANGAWGFRVWETTTPVVSSIGGGTVLGAAAIVNDWIVGEFDATTTNGDSIVVLFTRGDRSIGFQQWGQAGFTQLGAATLFGPNFIEPRAVAIRAIQAGRDDLAIIARVVSQAPRLELWNVAGPGNRILVKTVLGPDVR